MATIVYGELLAVTVRDWTNRETGDVSEIKSVSLYTPGDEDSTRVSMGRDFPNAQFRDLIAAESSRPLVAFEVFVSKKGALYANKLVDLHELVGQLPIPA